jgi:hypothetical protein
MGSGIGLAIRRFCGARRADSIGWVDRATANVPNVRGRQGPKNIRPGRARSIEKSDKRPGRVMAPVYHGGIA